MFAHTGAHPAHRRRLQKNTVRAFTSTTILSAPPSPELSKWRRLQRGERHIPLTLQSPQGPIWLEGGKGFNLGLIQLLLKWKFLPVRTSGVQSEDLHAEPHKAQRSQREAQPRISDKPSLSPSSCRASLLRDQDYSTVWRFCCFSSLKRRARCFFDFLNVSEDSVTVSFADNWDMITTPSASALKNSDHCAAWQSSGSRNSGVSKAFLHPAPPSDPARQAQRVPIKLLKMLTARSGHILHPEYLQPLPSTPVSPIEVRIFSISVKYFCQSSSPRCSRWTQLACFYHQKRFCSRQSTLLTTL